jgi:hypothetical protein
MGEKVTDPIETFRKLVTEFERGFDSLANGFMGTGEFSQAMNQLQSMQLSMQKAFNDAMASHLANFNMPSREDILRLGESIRVMEQRIAHIEELLVNNTHNIAAPKPGGPPRTRQAPSQKSEH